MAKPLNVLISGYIGFENFGDDAVFSLLVGYLQKKGLRVAALSSNPQKTVKAYMVDAYEYKNFSEIINAIKNTDILISGGGSLLQNKTSTKSLLYYLSIIFLAKLFGKKVIIFAQGIGPIKGSFWQFLTRSILKITDLVTVRDRDSQNLLASWGVRSKTVVDPVWSIPMPKHNPQNAIGVQVRDCKAALKHSPLEFLYSVGDFYPDKEIKIFCLQNSQDFVFSRQFYTLLKQKYPNINAKIITYTKPEKLLEEFATLERLIAMRFHACLVGLKMGVKVLPLSYDDKVTSFAREMQLPYVDLYQRNDYYQQLNDFYTYKEPEIVERKRKIKFDWEYFDKILDEEIK
ncbi:polysaccharide pyruvyl transferase CsaB [bacterium]|nr:polysaccharide pyruvyl transferase CsaB [bacterium]